MNACVLTIGDELLQGFTTDTNSTWLGTTLLPYGIIIQKKITVGDNINSIIHESKKNLSSIWLFSWRRGFDGIRNYIPDLDIHETRKLQDR